MLDTQRRGEQLQSERIVGKPVFRKEGLAKVLGSARYIDDISLPGMIFGATVRSAVPRGRVVSIEYGPGIPWDEFTIVTAKDIPGHNYVALISNDWPCLADGVVNHPQEPILLLAHPDRHLLPLAVAAVKIEYEELPSVHSIEESESGKTIVWGEDNIFKSYRWKRATWMPRGPRPDIIVEGEYRTGAQEQLYIENQGMIATANPNDGVTIWGSLQCPYYVHKALVPLIRPPGGKNSRDSGGDGRRLRRQRRLSVDDRGARGASGWKSGKPVKIIYDRAEDMVATTKRHPSRTRHRTGVTRDGKLVAMDIDFVLDGGAYATLSSVVLSRGTIHAAGPYFCPNVRVQCAGRGDQRSAARRVSRIRRAAKHFRGGAPHGSGGPRRESDAGRISAAKFSSQGPDDRTGQLIHEEVNFDGCSTARSGKAIITQSASASRGKIPARL